MNEQGGQPSDTRNAEFVDASSTTSSEEDAGKLSVELGKKCSEEEVSIAADEVDQAKPAVIITQQDWTTSLIGEKTANVEEATESSLEEQDSLVTVGGVQSQQQQEEQYCKEIMMETDESDIVVVDDEITFAFKKHKRRVEPNWLIYVR